MNREIYMMIEQTERPFEVPEMSRDKQVRVFRRLFAMKEGASTSEAMQVDSYAVITKHYVIFLDTLLCPEDMEHIMSSLQQECEGRQIVVVDSHADWDHCWGNSYFTALHAAPILAHDHCFTRLRSQEEQDGLQAYKQRYLMFRNVALTNPTLTFSQSFTIHDEDLTLELFSAPGHHLDQIAAWIPELRLLFAFDAAEWPLPLIENALGVPLMYSTLQHFLTLEPQHVLCSHGKTTDATVLQNNFDYLKKIEQRGRAFLTNTHTGLNLKELEHLSTLINYPFEEAIADITGSQNGLDTIPDPEFYGEAHENNTHVVLEWLASLT
ncbi:MAG TPA: hypothetical protein DHW02_01920 [Ktedonobacter sp.]|nr:hypothetical protein [Ktedonobacter sp.]